MSQKWEINRVSTPGRIFRKINEEMVQPVGIVLFGADCEFKKQVVEDLKNHLDGVVHFTGAPNTHKMFELLHSKPISLFVLSSMESADHELRHEAVKMMRDVGTKTVIGIYVKCGLLKQSPFITPTLFDSPYIRCTKTLTKNPPTTDGLDYLIVIAEDQNEADTTKILWSGLAGRTGREAIEQQAQVDGVEIVAGLTRTPMTFGRSESLGLRTPSNGGNLATELNGPKWHLYSELHSPLETAKKITEDFDVIVDFSHPDVFEQVVELAIRTNVPLISGTSGLSDRQMAMLYDATNRIPVFRGGNFRFKVKKFIDEAVMMAQNTDGRLVLIEDFYKGKSLPSETSKVIQQRIRAATGKEVEVRSSDDQGCGNLICEWEFQVREPGPETVVLDRRRCRTIGFDELAHDVLEIAKVMARKPVKKGKFYDLDKIWDELPH